MKASKVFSLNVAIFVFILSTIATGNAFKILGIFPTMAKSHFITGSALMRGLAANGHEVTVISPFPQSKPIKNYRDIPTEGIIEIMKKTMPNILDLNKQSVIESSVQLLSLCTTISNWTITHPNVQKLLHDPTEHFDVVVMEIFLTDAMLGFGAHFNAPTIGFSTFGTSKWTTDLVGSPSPLSYVPSPFLSFSDKMSFAQRVGNTLMAILDEIMHRTYFPTQVKMYKDAFPKAHEHDLDDLRSNVALVLLNNHFTMNYPRPYAPNMIEIGGIHINRAAPKELPQDIKEFIDSARDGVVYFSMGSNIQSTQLPVDVRDGLLRAFAKLKQKVLWKWEDVNLPGKPANVMINKWYPQDDVLAHPNIRLFITHGGLLSSTEAIYHGVPIIGIPVFGDQHLNMARAVNNGYGLAIAYSNLTESSISWALNEMLKDEKYTERAKEISARYRDQPQEPLKTAVYWVEYVARHKGAPHMHSAGQDLNWFAYHNVDVYAFLAALVYIVSIWIKKLILAIVGKLFVSKKTNQDKMKKKKN